MPMNDINYLIPLKFLEEYGGKPYKKPERTDISEEEKNRYIEMRVNAVKATSELEKIAELCEKKFKLKSETIYWKTPEKSPKINKFLWVQLKYNKDKKDPVSISIFAENAPKPRYRFCLELKDNNAKDGDLEKFHRHLEIDKLDGLEYFNAKDGTILSQSREELREEIKKDSNLKVQIGRVVENENELTNENIEKIMLDTIEKLIPFYKHVIGKNNPEDNPKYGGKDMEDNFGKNMILYGPPGTGKTYNTAIYAVAICCPEKSFDEWKKADYETEVMPCYKELKGQNNNRITFTTFHQSYGYEEFIEGIKPVLSDKYKTEETNQSGDIKYKIEPGIFKKFCDAARKDENKNYVFIIDEINRGNISKIFGELITLIEDTKREGRPEAISAKLPYSGDDFSVPNNVYIIGTMNTADRSIALMDTALRRRFQFIEMMPNCQLLDNVTIEQSNQKLEIGRMLETINKRIECLYDREHTIGHALFMRLTAKSNIKDLQKIFEKSVIPLLQEYFYEDYQKIQLILGDNAKTNEKHKFIKETKNTDVFKGNVDIDLPETRYELNKKALNDIESYIEIYEENTQTETEKPKDTSDNK